MKGPPLGPGGEDITWPDQVAPCGRRTPSARKVKPQTSNLLAIYSCCSTQLSSLSASGAIRPKIALLPPRKQHPN